MVLAVDAPAAVNPAGGGGFIGWVLVFGGILMIHSWLMVYAMYLGQERGQGVYFWMILTLIFGPLAILALWRQPTLRTCPKCGMEGGSDEPTCAHCGYAFRSSHEDAQGPQPRLPQELDDDGLTT